MLPARSALAMRSIEGVDAAVDAEREPVARPLIASSARSIRGPRNARRAAPGRRFLLRQIVEAISNATRRDESPVRAPPASGAGAMQRSAALASPATCLSSAFRLRVDDRPDVGVRARRVADHELIHRAGEELDHARRDLLLHAQHAQRRAALARAVEGRGHSVVHHLLGQRRGVDDHRVLSAGFRDQRNDGRACGKGAVDGARGLGRTREGDARDPAVADQRCADGRLRRPEATPARRRARPPRSGTARRARRRAASARPAWRRPRCPPRAPRRPGRRRSPAESSTGKCTRTRHARAATACSIRRSAREAQRSVEVRARLLRVVAQKSAASRTSAIASAARLAGFAREKRRKRRAARSITSAARSRTTARAAPPGVRPDRDQAAAAGATAPRASPAVPMTVPILRVRSAGSNASRAVPVAVPRANIGVAAASRVAAAVNAASSAAIASWSASDAPAELRRCRRTGPCRGRDVAGA